MYEVRKIRESDIEGFNAAVGSVVNERKYLLTLDPPQVQDTARFIRSNIKNNFGQYVAVAEGQVVGWADIIPQQKEALSHVGVLGIGVILEHRGKGFGKELLTLVIDYAWKVGLKRLELEVFASNVGAIALYEKFGFMHEGTKRNGRLVDGRYEDVHIMAQCRL